LNITLKKTKDVDLAFTAPPSKSYTHRAVIVAALAEGDSRIHHPLMADDTGCTIAALRSSGISIIEQPDLLQVEGCAGRPPCGHGLVLDLDNSGTSYRLLAGYALLCRSPVVLTGSPRMLERPVGPLVDGLNALGGDVTYLARPGFPPIKVSGTLKGGTTSVDGRISSQFISSILITAPYAESPVDVRICGEPASRSYIDLTCDAIRAFGGRVQREGYERFCVSPEDRYRGRNYAIEGDYSSASYFFAIAAVCGGRVRVDHLNPASLQGDRLFVSALETMGCKVSTTGTMIEVSGDGHPDGIEIDMSSAPDTVQTLCMVAAGARSPTRITGVSHLRYKESDRLAVTAAFLRRLGGSMQITDDEIIIHPSRLHGGTIDPQNDHRTAMSFTVLGLGIGDVTILQADCVTKSFPGFWDHLAGAGLL
jgi:3-phosphoshikimate 1-carboxyvinyltransferase